MATELYQPCIDSCQKALLACETCAEACKSEGNAQMMQRCIALDIDCAEFCKLAIDFMQRESEFCSLICEDCAEICRECAEECAKHPQEHCQICAQMCNACADTCLSMAYQG